ncbi:MAG: HNH endonuclease [Magnetococcales bacterium]|nr:HNH endonuclease [Magnetococcales bacterium]
MKSTSTTIDKIVELLGELEKELDSSDQSSVEKNFDALEMPEMVGSIVDHLQPLLTPYEAAVYWYMFRHSIVNSGTQYVRVSTRGMQINVAHSASGQGSTLSLDTVRTALSGLEKKDAILKAGDINREGTLYKVFLPEEIHLCQESMKSKQQLKINSIDEKKDLDFYNVQENRMQVYERDEFKCYYCKKQLTRFNASLDHIQPVSRGGDNSFDNLITACLHCNSRRGNKPVMEAIINAKDVS